jgi:hypothetical protein
MPLVKKAQDLVEMEAEEGTLAVAVMVETGETVALLSFFTPLA